MRINGQTTVEAIRETVPDLLVIPQLFAEPPEGYVAWATQSAQMKAVNPDTVSGRLIAATGPAWFYGRLLPHILTGRYETELRNARQRGDERIVLDDALEVALPSDPSGEWLAAAQKARLEFELGRPLYIAPLGSIERYRRVPVTLTCLGQGQYRLGQNGETLKFQAAGHSQALDKARQVYFSAREKEIEAARDAAGQFAKTAPRLVLDCLTTLLQRDKVLLDTDGAPLAWENGAHGLYAAQGPDWCYLLECSAARAAQFAAIAQQQAVKQGQASVLFQVDLKGQAAELFGLAGWQRSDNGIDWQGGQWRPLKGETDRGMVLVGGQPRFVAEVKGVIGRVYSLKKEVLLESPSPASWGLTPDDVLVWAVWAGLRIEKRKEDKE